MRYNPTLPVSIEEMASFFSGQELSDKNVYPDPVTYYINMEDRMQQVKREFNQDSLNKTVHIMLQNKGGVGKTYVCLLLAQFFNEYCPDLNRYYYDLETPKAKCFSKYSSLNIKTFEVTDNQGNIDRSKFDEIFNPILDESVKDGIILIDVGATLFHEVLKYFAGLSQIIPFIRQMGWRVCIHTVLTGDDIRNCLDGYEQIRTVLKGGYQTVIWHNNYFGTTERATQGKTFTTYVKDLKYNSIFLPYREKEMDNVMAFIKRYKLRFCDVRKYLRATPPDPDADAFEHDDEREAIKISALDACRLDNYLHMSTSDGISRRDGIFELMRKFDWNFTKSQPVQQEEAALATPEEQ